MTDHPLVGSATIGVRWLKARHPWPDRGTALNRLFGGIQANSPGLAACASQCSPGFLRFRHNVARNAPTLAAARCCVALDVGFAGGDPAPGTTPGGPARRAPPERPRARWIERPCAAHRRARSTLLRRSLDAGRARSDSRWAGRGLAEVSAHDRLGTCNAWNFERLFRAGTHRVRFGGSHDAGRERSATCITRGPGGGSLG
jgi:hypothetical protein